MNRERRNENRDSINKPLWLSGSPFAVLRSPLLMPSFFILSSSFFILHSFSAAQPLQPPRPARYQVVLRYDIPAARDQHVVQYDALIDYLKKLAFAFEPSLDKLPETDREDRSKNYLRGY